jgi:hypothetical protein
MVAAITLVILKPRMYPRKLLPKRLPSPREHVRLRQKL